MGNLRRILYTTTLAALIGAPAFGASWAEVGDAPELLPGQATVGEGPLTTISGSVEPGLGTSPLEVADLYCIQITNEALFAVTAEVTSAETQQIGLHLFNAAGDAVASYRGEDTSAFLDSTFVNFDGVAFLAVAIFDVLPVDIEGDAVFTSIFNDQVEPNPGLGPLAGWQQIAGEPIDYEITLTGATFHIPEPSTLGLLGLAGAWLAMRRK